MEILKRIEGLPDYMNLEDLSKEFNVLLDFYENDPEFDKIQIAECLLELSDRQWHTYEVIEKAIAKRIDEWIRIETNLTSIELMDAMICVILMLGLQESYDYIKQIPLRFTDRKLTFYMEDTIKEYGEDISDPYDSMRNLKPQNDKLK